MFALFRQVSARRDDVNRLQRDVEQAGARGASQLASQEQSHAAAMQQLATSHAAAVEAERAERRLEVAKLTSAAKQHDADMSATLARVQAELDAGE